MVQKALLNRIKDTGLTSGQPKILDYLMHHDGAIQKKLQSSPHRTRFFNRHFKRHGKQRLHHASDRQRQPPRTACIPDALRQRICLPVTAGICRNWSAYAGRVFGIGVPRISKFFRTHLRKHDERRNKQMKHLKVRILMYFIGLFIMTIGIALSVKSNLGVSPVSSIPYTITCVWGIEMGKATILFHIVLVLLQILLLRKNLNRFSFCRF